MIEVRVPVPYPVTEIVEVRVPIPIPEVVEVRMPCKWGLHMIYSLVLLTLLVFQNIVGKLVTGSCSRSLPSPSSIWSIRGTPGCTIPSTPPACDPHSNSWFYLVASIRVWVIHTRGCASAGAPDARRCAYINSNTATRSLKQVQLRRLFTFRCLFLFQSLCLTPWKSLPSSQDPWKTRQHGPAKLNLMISLHSSPWVILKA